METEYAWSAGFFDGEGTTCTYGGYLRENGTRHLDISLSVSQKTRPLLERFKAAVTVGHVKESKTNQMCSFATGSFPDILTALMKMWPYLGEQKKQQANVAIKRYLGQSRWGKEI